MQLKEIEKEITQLSNQEQAKLLHNLLHNVSQSIFENFDGIWLQETKDRWEKFQASGKKGYSDTDILEKAKLKLKK